MTIKRRAIRDDQKQVRRQAILEKAWELFQQTHYESINLLDLAAQIGLAKGTLYLYFPTKEALFLSILEDQFTEWFDELDVRMTDAGATLTTAQIIDGIVDSIAHRPALTRLFSIAPVILEHNVSYEAARNYKRLLLERVTKLGGQIEAQFAFFRRGQGAEFLMRGYALITGVECLAHPTELIRTVIKDDPELAPFQVDFRETLRELLTGLLERYQKQGDRNE